MDNLSHNLLAAAQSMSPWEAAALALAIAYLVLAIRQNIACWPAALASTSIYVLLMYQAGLYMESALQLFYIAMAVYGWIHWRRGEGPDHPLAVTRRPLSWHALAIAVVLVITLLSGWLLTRHTDAALPYLDSFTTWGAIVATWMVARKILENWYYWFVIDSVSIYLYVSRGLFLTALLFALYLVLIVIGYRTWRRSMQPDHV